MRASAKSSGMTTGEPGNLGCVRLQTAKRGRLLNSPAATRGARPLQPKVSSLEPAVPWWTRLLWMEHRGRLTPCIQSILKPILHGRTCNLSARPRRAGCYCRPELSHWQCSRAHWAAGRPHPTGSQLCAWGRGCGSHDGVCPLPHCQQCPS